ncbi:hypothetical protein Glo7428_2449 [Gloeocapsa sp. PCC 7428]|nr:hypothetical protein Glo7428_2449 [Gloeocapsa sp. PCC 7428]
MKVLNQMGEETKVQLLHPGKTDLQLKYLGFAQCLTQLLLFHSL